MITQFRQIELGELAIFKTGKLDSNAAVENGKYPFFTCSRETFQTNTYSFDDEVVLLAGNNAAGIFPLKYFKGKFDAYQRTYVIRTIDETKLQTRFLYFALRPLLNHLRDISTGAATKFLTIGLLKSLKIPLPDLPTQKKIAGILSAYDDLIENNLRRIAILEEMAQSLYREWFVHFRFPGHEKAKFIDSELGKIPEGWEVKKLSEIANLTMGLSPKGNTYNDQGLGTALVNGPVEFGDRFTKAIKWTTAPTKLCKNNDLIVCVRGSTTGKHVKSNGVYCLGRGVCSLSSMYQSFIDYLFKDQLRTLLAMTNGSTFPSWTGPLLKSHPVLSPPESLIKDYDRFGKKLNLQIQTLACKNDNLRKTRDLLLPKLLSSE